jgi:CubicO group peptidase (beta-lactamase class C family)
LEQQVCSIIDEFKTPIHEKITIFHLITHTSGLGSEAAHMEPYPRQFWREDRNRENWIKIDLQGPLETPVGTAWSYCNRGFQFLAEIIARISGKPYHEYIHTHILEPLGMTRTFFVVPDDLKDQVCVVTEWDKQQVFRKPDEKIVTSSWAGAGGLYSTPHDLWKFAQMMLNKGTFNNQRILGRISVEAMTRYHLHDIPAPYHWGKYIKAKPYGLGCLVAPEGLLHSPGTFGHDGAAWSSMVIDPVEEFICIYMQPCDYDTFESQMMIGGKTLAWGGLL